MVSSLELPQSQLGEDLTVVWTGSEVDRAMDNLVKSGKMFPQQRRDSMPVIPPRAFPVEHGKNNNNNVLLIRF